MNKLIIIGNGFDLHHNIPSSYSDFLHDLVLNEIKEASTKVPEDFHPYYYQGKLFELKFHRQSMSSITNNGILDVVKLIIEALKNNKPDNRDKKTTQKYIENGKQYIIELRITSSLFKTIFNTNICNWGDIELAFYKRLEILLKEYENTTDKKTTIISQLDDCNNDLEYLKDKLKLYLLRVSKDRKLLECFNECLTQDIPSKIFNDFNFIENILDKKDFIDDKTIKKDKVYIINFNYTNLIQQISTEKYEKIINIHGELDNINNPMIFGFGDEMDDNYTALEKTNINSFLTNIKSFGYFFNSNYQKLLRIIEENNFIVDIWGHSCNLSDRTLLNMIFEHNNCRAIRPYYWKKNNNTDNYIEMTQNISRHFIEKKMMRIKLVNKTNCNEIGNQF